MAHARNDTVLAAEEYRLSLQQAENPWALRCLALLEKETAPARLLRSARMKPIRPLVLEAMEALLKAEDYASLLDFSEGLPAALKEDGRVKTYRAAALLRSGRLDEAEAILRGPIVLSDVREGNTLLTDLWFEAAALRRFGRADAEALAWAEENVPPPENLDFRML